MIIFIIPLSLVQDSFGSLSKFEIQKEPCMLAFCHGVRKMNNCVT